MAARDIVPTEKMIPLITGEIAFRQNVCELVLGINIFDLDFGTQFDSVGSGHVSHRRTSVFYNHFDYCLNVFENASTSSRLGTFFVLVMVGFWKNATLQ